MGSILGAISMLKILIFIGKILEAIGSPVLQLIKLLFKFVFWIGDFTIDVVFKKIKKIKKSLKKIKLPKLRFKRRLLPPITMGVAMTRKKLAIIGIVGLLIIFFVGVYRFLASLPDPRQLSTREVALTTKIYDRNGVLLYQFYDGENRSLVSTKDLPPYVINATLAIEDQNFYKHMGIDPMGIFRAAWSNFTGAQLQGGSTITQQLIKKTLLTPERTISRKIKEIILALWTERIYSKEEILTMYLNQVPYGGPAYGIEAAAETYFGKKAHDLTLAEAALIAGLPSAPSAYSPFGANPELARVRQKQVIEAMEKNGYISKFVGDATIKEPLKFAPTETAIKAPHFVMYVKDLLAKKYGIRKVERGGLTVITSLDYGLYQESLRLVREGVEKQKYLNVGNGAALITNPKTGEILSMVGSINFFDLGHDGNVNVTTAQRSPGSSIKPLNYALAFDRGILTPGTVLDDSPVAYKVAGQPVYSPGNYDGRFHGKVTARVALASSYNIPAVKVLEKNGLKNFIEFSQKLGITTFTDPSRYGLALTLGGGEILMTDMARAYSTFANNGVNVPLKAILEVNGVKEESGFNNTRTISEQTAFLINNILADDGARAPTFGAGSALNIPGHTVAVKTGTAETKRDNWTIGYSFGPDPRLVAVWVGNNDNSPMSPFLESGNTGAAAIWNPLVKLALGNSKDYPIDKPGNIVAVNVCGLGGLLPCENCPFTKTEYFTSGTEPKMACNFTKEEVERILHPEKQDKKD